MPARVAKLTKANLSVGFNIFYIYLKEFCTNFIFSPSIDPLTSTTHIKSIWALYFFNYDFTDYIYKTTGKIYEYSWTYIDF